MSPKRLLSFSPEETFLRLPHPYLTNYSIQPQSPQLSPPTTSNDQGPQAPRDQYFTLLPNAIKPVQPGGQLPAFPFHRSDLSFSAPRDPPNSLRPAESNNTLWGRARRCPSVSIVWGFEGCPSDGGERAAAGGARRDEPPSLAQLWLLVYALFTYRPSVESFRVAVLGPGHDHVRRLLLDSLLGVMHPEPVAAPGSPAPGPTPGQEGREVLILRASFWQGAGSPFGPRPAWLPSSPSFDTTNSNLPPLPLVHTLTYQNNNTSSSRPVRHPVRPSKPTAGSVVYSRYIPHLRETFSMVAMDAADEKHVELFHKWQNDPRVSAGWNESGSLEHHRGYLEKLRGDPSQIPLLAYWDEKPFAYFEVYWAKEDRLGAYYDSSDYDRGRHSLVGDPSFRGPHRVTAWWASLIHYLFLDESRTMRVVGEPKASNGTVLMYDFMAGFGMMGFAELPHKRSAMVGLARERFFEVCPFGADVAGAEEGVGANGDGITGGGVGGYESLKVVGGTGVGLVPKL